MWWNFQCELCTIFPKSFYLFLQLPETKRILSIFPLPFFENSTLASRQFTGDSPSKTRIHLLRCSDGSARAGGQRQRQWRRRQHLYRCGIRSAIFPTFGFSALTDESRLREIRAGCETLLLLQIVSYHHYHYKVRPVWSWQKLLLGCWDVWQDGVSSISISAESNAQSFQPSVSLPYQMNPGFGR